MIASEASWSFVGVTNGYLKYALRCGHSSLGTALLRRGRPDAAEGAFEQAQRDVSAPEHRDFLTHMTGLLVFNLNNGLISSPV